MAPRPRPTRSSSTMVTMAFDALDPERLQSVLARYVVLSRGHPGCRNIDLAMSTTQPNRFVIIQKWERPRTSRPTSTRPTWSTMAEGCAGLLAGPPADRPARADLRPRPELTLASRHAARRAASCGGAPLMSAQVRSSAVPELRRTRRRRRR